MKLSYGMAVVGLALLTYANQAIAAPIGMHIMQPEEIDRVAEVLQDHQENYFVTIPILIDQLDHQKWQLFFDKAKKYQITPVLRLATRFNSQQQAWDKPSRGEIVRFAQFFSSLSWPQPQRYLIIYNEPNHAKEWGGETNPDEYADILEFAIDWFHTEPYSYQIMPAGLDAAAPNGSVTMDSFLFLEKMMSHSPAIVAKIDLWNSHAYPNPAFSASAQKSGKNGIDGWRYELEFIKQHYNRDLKVFISETGWDHRQQTSRTPTSHYEYAITRVWNDSAVVGVTPFIFQGDNGVFDMFSFVDNHGNGTVQLTSLLAAIEKQR